MFNGLAGRLYTPFFNDKFVSYDHPRKNDFMDLQRQKS